VVVLHIALWTAALFLSFLLRFDFDVNPLYWELFPRILAVFIVVRVAMYLYFGLFHGLWRYSGSHDLKSLLKAATVSSALSVFGIKFFGPSIFPRSIYIIEWLASIMLVGGLRFAIRIIREIAVRNATPQALKRRILIVGAGDAAEALVREIVRMHANR